MKIGIVGLPFSGKTSLFTALTGAQAPAQSGKKEAQHAIVKVPDARLDALDKIYQPRKKTPATIEYIDLSGLSADEQKKGGFSDQFLGQIRIVDAILVIVRLFDNENVPHPLRTINADRDLQLIQAEFILSDLSIIENRMGRLEKQMRVRKTDQDAREFALLEKFKEQIEQEKPLRDLVIAPQDELLIRGYQFLTLKPHIIVLNINEKDISAGQELTEPLKAWLQHEKTSIWPVSAQIEMEIGQLAAEEAEIFRKDAGISEAAMDKLIRASYELLGLMSFFTVGEDEVRAWTIKQYTPAPQAAGEIHSDIERGYIRAEVVSYNDFIARETMAKCRSDAVLHLEGKEYIVKDGDIINFRFAV
jgi:ribosome-binding ATPase